MCLNKKFEVKENMTVTWHAGAMDTEANTLSSIKTALDANADIVEFDVSSLPDGTPVIIHADFADDPTLPTLEDALKLTAQYEKTSINLDMKNTVCVKQVDELVHKYGLEKRAFYTGINEDWIDAVKNNSTLPCYLNAHPREKEKLLSDAADGFMKNAISLGVAGININFREITPAFLSAVKKYNLPLSVWTPSNDIDIMLALEMKPDNITSRRPDIVKKYIK